MIRDGKRSISKDLVRFLEFIDGIALKRHGLSFKAMKNMNFGHPKIVTKEGFWVLRLEVWVGRGK